MKSLDEIIAEVNPDVMKAVLTERREKIERLLTEDVLNLQLEELNPDLKPADKKASLTQIVTRIHAWQKFLDEIDQRLHSAHAHLVSPTKPKRTSQPK